jgi:hypothetical protein
VIAGVLLVCPFPAETAAQFASSGAPVPQTARAYEPPETSVPPPVSPGLAV